jgi:hypothetical protein
LSELNSNKEILINELNDTKNQLNDIKENNNFNDENKNEEINQLKAKLLDYESQNDILNKDCQLKNEQLLKIKNSYKEFKQTKDLEIETLKKSILNEQNNAYADLCTSFNIVIKNYYKDDQNNYYKIYNQVICLSLHNH